MADYLQSQYGEDLKPPESDTGIPSAMQREFEDRSGFSFDDVRVHYNSAEPAKLGALAYTRGSEVHIGPGQEKHLGHELGHVVQQKLGLVKPTITLGGLPVNDSPRLESASDSIAQMAGRSETPARHKPVKSNVVQRKIGFEFQCKGKAMVYACTLKPASPGGSAVAMQNVYNIKKCKHGVHLKDFADYKLTGDMGDLEYVSAAVDELAAGGADRARAVCAAMAAGTEDVLGSLGIGETADKYIDVAGESAVQLKTQTGSGNEHKTYYKIPGTSCMLRNDRSGEKLKAHPQATIGVKLTNLADFLDNYSKRSAYTPSPEVPEGEEIKFGGSFSDESHNTTLFVNYQRGLLPTIKRATEGSNRLPDSISSEVKGLAMLLKNMADETALITTGKIKNAKSALPIMPRTSFWDIFKKLSPKAQDQMKGVAVKYFITKGKPDVTIAKQSRSKTRKVKQGSEYVETTLTQLINIFEGTPTDPFKKFSGIGEVMNTYDDSGEINAAATAYNLRNYGLTSSTDLHGDETPGILLELRALQRGVVPAAWGNLGEAVAKLSIASHNP